MTRFRRRFFRCRSWCWSHAPFDAIWPYVRPHGEPMLRGLCIIAANFKVTDLLHKKAQYIRQAALCTLKIALKSVAPCIKVAKGFHLLFCGFVGTADESYAKDCRHSRHRKHGF